METKNKQNAIVRSVLIGIGVTILYLLIGTVLAYSVTQVLSQYFIPNCSEDCYFRYFNSLFIIVVLFSIAGGIQGGIRRYKHEIETGRAAKSG